MTGSTKDQIAFDVETGRILEILSSEIYDSPKAFLITTQAKRNLSSRSGIGGVRSAT